MSWLQQVEWRRWAVQLTTTGPIRTQKEMAAHQGHHGLLLNSYVIAQTSRSRC